MADTGSTRAAPDVIGDVRGVHAIDPTAKLAVTAPPQAVSGRSVDRHTRLGAHEQPVHVDDAERLWPRSVAPSSKPAVHGSPGATSSPSAKTDGSGAHV